MWDNNCRSVWANSGNGIVAYPYIKDGSGLVSGVSVGAVMGSALVEGLACGGDMDVVCAFCSFSIVVVGWVVCVGKMW